MLSKNERFSTSDLSKLKILKSKKIIVNNGFFVVYNGYKKGILLTKKVFKKAVDRNKYKRLFYNTVLDLQKTNKEIKDKSFIFHPKKIFTKNELRQDLQKNLTDVI